MVDFLKLQKISNIARELMKHGQASSMEEAMRIAAEQVETGNVPQYMEESKSVVMPSQETAELKIEQTVAPSDADMQRITHILNQQQSTIAKMSNVLNVHTNQMNEVTMLQTKFNQLLKEITEIKDEVAKIRKSPVAPMPDSKGQTQFKAASSKPAEQPKPQGVGHVRSGNYNPDDVSIEKFFYYGGR